MNSRALKLAPRYPLSPVIPPIAQWDSIDIAMDRSSVELPAPLEALAAMDNFPLPQTANREGYHDDRHGDYWFSGLKDYLLSLETAWRLGVLIGKHSSIFDLGCASGWVLRHFAIQTGCRCKGADINSNHVEWINRYLPPNASAIDTTFHPPMPLADKSFDLSCAFSVFTHIEDFETAWLQEIARVTRPGGLVLATIHSENTWRNIKGTYLYHFLNTTKDRIGDSVVSDEFFERPLPSPRFVMRMQTEVDVYNTVVFHHTEHIKEVWSRFMDVLEIIPAGHEYHDVVVMRPLPA